MAKYYLKSIIGEIANGIKKMMNEGIIVAYKPVIIYGLDRHAFAIRTILDNYGLNNVECYVSDDEEAVIKFKQDIINFSCKFLNYRTNLIDVKTVEERLGNFDDDVTILIASDKFEDAKAQLERFRYINNKHFYQVFDFKYSKIESLLSKGKKLNPDELKEAEKSVLKYLDEICGQMGIQYWVCGGSSIGAMRHKGFIPWDDDIDVYMPWDDYKRFMKEFRDNDRYCLLGFGTDSENDFTDPFAKLGDKQYLQVENLGTLIKVYPVGLDIFPIVGLPDDKVERNLVFANYSELNRSMWQNFYATNGNEKVFGDFYKSQLDILTRNDFNTSNYVGVVGTAYGSRDCCRKSVYDKTLRVPFEDIEVNIPEGYNEYLTNLYGSDWNQLPDESKRKPHHNIDVYDMGDTEKYNRLFK